LDLLEVPAAVVVVVAGKREAAGLAPPGSESRGI